MAENQPLGSWENPYFHGAKTLRSGPVGSEVDLKAEKAAEVTLGAFTPSQNEVNDSAIETGGVMEYYFQKSMMTAEAAILLEKNKWREVQGSAGDMAGRDY